MIKTRVCVFIMSIVILAASIQGCDYFIKKPTEPSIEPLSLNMITSYNWIDDLQYQGLERAIQQSIKYYNKLPPTYTFSYGGLTYSPAEMAASLNLFLDITKSYDNSEIKKQLHDKFHFYESKNEEGNTLFTGYYEPVLSGSLLPEGDFTEPVYETPSDLIQVDLSLFADQWKSGKVVGRLEDNRLVPYDSREEIVYLKSLSGRAEPIAYVNGVELFFLQIQGSGLIRLKDDSIIRVNYASKNGRPYKSIGTFLSERIPQESMSLQGIKKYLYSHPNEVREILSHNESYIFFRVVDEGPLGNINVPLTASRSIAMDSRIVPKGGLAYIDTEIPVFKNGSISKWIKIKRFVLVQDTGSAIREHGRVDLFIGSGIDAGMIAGSIKNSGRSFLIIARKEFLNKPSTYYSN